MFPLYVSLERFPFPGCFIILYRDLFFIYFFLFLLRGAPE